jgi:F-type H+-transporting ATPase subunit b
MRFDWSTLALQTVNFVILVWLLHRFLYKPVLRMVDARRAAVEKQYADAGAAEAKAIAQRAAIEAERACIAAERASALEAATAQAEDAAVVRRTRAEHDAAALLDGARKTIAAERDQVLVQARRTALELGSEIAGRLLADLPIALRTEAWIERIAQHMAALPTPELDVLTRQLTDGAVLAVTTAAALPATAAEAWRSQLHRTLGDQITIAFAVDPSLIAGAELHFPNAVLRFSWQSALAALRADIEAHGDAL